MFIRQTETVNKKTGEVYRKFQLVESYRCEAGPRQRIVMTLPELDLDKSRWPYLATAISERLAGTTSLFEDDPVIRSLADIAMTKYKFRGTAKAIRQEKLLNADFKSVDLTTATTTSSRSHGAEIVVSGFYERLRFDEILRCTGMSENQRNVAKAVILSRLIAPGSDLGTFRHIKGNASLAVYIGF